MGIICHVGCRKCGRSITVPLGGLELCQKCQDKAMGYNGPAPRQITINLGVLSAEDCIERITALQRITEAMLLGGDFWLDLHASYLIKYQELQESGVPKPKRVSLDKPTPPGPPPPYENVFQQQRPRPPQGSGSFTVEM